AVAAARLAVRDGAGQPQESKFLTTLADALRSRFERSGAAPDLDEAIAAGRRLVAVRGGGRFRDLTGLTTDLLVRFDRGHAPADLDEATAIARQAVQVAPPDVRLGALRLLDQLVSARFEVAGAPSDEDEVIATRRA
ncbi:hypothetical protein, partial [Amycolatopsis sp. SID8362]|uniref:hypothetical protein n=1 Tax=Amycolatopsis sp. SID8362 TaxID=2690346 RepID=UPI00142BF433